jgi:hypothetical protein
MISYINVCTDVPPVTGTVAPAIVTSNVAIVSVSVSPANHAAAFPLTTILACPFAKTKLVLTIEAVPAVDVSVIDNLALYVPFNQVCIIPAVFVTAISTVLVHAEDVALLFTVAGVIDITKSELKAEPITVLSLQISANANVQFILSSFMFYNTEFVM